MFYKRAGNIQLYVDTAKCFLKCTCTLKTEQKAKKFEVQVQM